MNVDLSPDLEALIQRLVASGRCDNPSEVVTDALRLLGTRDRLRESHASMLRTALAEGLAQADRGELIDGPEAISEVRRLLHERRASND